MVEVTRPLNRKPLAHEINVMSTKKASGFMHYVDVMVKDRATGLVALRPYAVKSDVLLSRGQAVKKALAGFINAINNNPGEYPEQVLGAVYTATYQMIPGE